MDKEKVHLKATADLARYNCMTADGVAADTAVLATANQLVGITEGPVPSGVWGDATSSGTIFDVNWNWTPGFPIYLNGKVLSHTPPLSGYLQQLGWAISRQSMLVKIQLAIPI